MKVGIAHGTASAAQALEAAITRNGEHRVLWSVTQGDHAIARAMAEPPDLLLLDLELTNSDCIEVTREITRNQPCCILLVSSRSGVRTARIYEAMGLGALDVVPCPRLLDGGQIIEHEGLETKLLTVGRLLGVPSRIPTAKPTRSLLPKLVAIGASTGGPHALSQILAGLPQTTKAALVIVQHVDSEFSSGLAEWLQQSTTLHVELAREGATPRAGTALIATTNDHLVMTRSRTFAYTAEPRDVPYRPSVDALFGTLATHWPSPGVAVLLTGMGRDGAVGLKRLRDARWRTFAQDQASAVVFGMPKAAIELGAAERVVPLSQMAHVIADACAR